jgi:hypothetical protein
VLSYARATFGALTPKEETAMVLSRRSLETLLDLVEVKLSCMEVIDREDAREFNLLEGCKRELLAFKAAARTALPAVPSMVEAA